MSGTEEGWGWCGSGSVSPDKTLYNSARSSNVFSSRVSNGSWAAFSNSLKSMWFFGRSADTGLARALAGRGINIPPIAFDGVWVVGATATVFDWPAVDFAASLTASCSGNFLFATGECFGLTAGLFRRFSSSCLSEKKHYLASFYLFLTCSW